MATGGLLAIFAHPDDETFGVGGTMAHYASHGVPVTMICATRGEVGEIAAGSKATPETLGQFREQELRDAMGILGVTDVRFLDYRDSGMKGTDDNNNPRAFMNATAADVVPGLVRAIRERRPDVVVTWDESGGYGHPDHVAIHHHTTAAFREAGDASKHQGLGEPWGGATLFYTAIPIQEFSRVMDEMRKQGIDVPEFVGDDIGELPRVDPNCIIDVSEFFERKIQAMLAHSSQITGDDPFMRMPENIQRGFFGREYFYRAHPLAKPGETFTDLLG
jgi:LmbE family N-acetylglucosaminyl deacetylase